MSLPRTVADVLHQHVTLELECIDRMYLNVYQPNLQMERKVYHYLRQQHGAGAVSSRYFQSMTQAFVKSIEDFAAREKIALLSDGRGGPPIYGKEGDVIEGRYKIVRIGTESIEVAYLDGHGRQTIRLTGQ